MRKYICVYVITYTYIYKHADTSSYGYTHLYTYAHTCLCAHIIYIDNMYHIHICTYIHIRYTEQTRDHQKPKMCTSNYFFSEGRPRLLLEAICGATDLVSCTRPLPCRLSIGSAVPVISSWAFPVFLTGHCACCQWRSYSTLGKI